MATGSEAAVWPPLTHPFTATRVMCAVSVCAVCPWLAGKRGEGGGEEG